MGFLVPLAAAAIPMFGGTAGAVATGLSATGSILEGVSSMGQHRYRAQVAKNNALIHGRNSDQALVEGQSEESRHRYKTAQLVGAQKAAQAANGVDVAFGSPVDVRTESATMGDYDALMIRYNSAKDAYGERLKAADSLAEAKMQRAAGRFALAKSFIGAASSIVGGMKPGAK